MKGYILQAKGRADWQAVTVAEIDPYDALVRPTASLLARIAPQSRGPATGERSRRSSCSLHTAVEPATRFTQATAAISLS